MHNFNTFTTFDNGHKHGIRGVTGPTIFVPAEDITTDSEELLRLMVWYRIDTNMKAEQVCKLVN
ncbi:hypothetical protein [Desertibacillus haloalkaliphilus]|uniref:hypothetical protein n=1 Tax=Desertibacillus haloalkaliphilus TaxID=1328930 RepID=UPI0028B1D22D|nr:hypothetical protein [Desertibacillus haloalkaliphilus]